MSMRAVTTTDLRVLNTTLDAKFLHGYGEAPIFYPEVCSVSESGSASSTYPILAAFPELREWVGERIANELAAHSVVLINKHWELSMGIDKDDVADMSYGGALLNVGGISIRAKQHPEKLLTDILLNGDTYLGYDGKALWATDHYIDVKAKTGSQRNYYPAGSAKALTATTWEEVRGIMNGFKDDKGVPIGVEPTICMVPAQLRGAAERIFKTQYDPSGATNVNFGTAKVIVNPRLNGDPTTWYAIDASAPLRPFIYQLRESVKFTMMTEVTNENVYRHKRFEYGVDGRWIVGAGAWFRAFKAMV